MQSFMFYTKATYFFSNDKYCLLKFANGNAWEFPYLFPYHATLKLLYILFGRYSLFNSVKSQPLGNSACSHPGDNLLCRNLAPMQTSVELCQ